MPEHIDSLAMDTQDDTLSTFESFDFQDLVIGPTLQNLQSESIRKQMGSPVVAIIFFYPAHTCSAAVMFQALVEDYLVRLESNTRCMHDHVTRTDGSN